MATTRAANVVEKAIGHRDNAETQQDVSHPARGATEEGETMKVLVWKGKKNVQIGTPVAHLCFGVIWRLKSVSPKAS
jgi:hypothetical protein